MTNKTLLQLEQEIDSLSELPDFEFHTRYLQLKRQLRLRQTSNIDELVNSLRQSLHQRVSESEQIDKVINRAAIENTSDRLLQAGYIHRPNYYIDSSPTPSSLSSGPSRAPSSLLGVADSEATGSDLSSLLTEVPLEADELALLAEIAPEAFAATLVAYGTYKAGEEIWHYFKANKGSKNSVAGQPPITPREYQPPQGPYYPNHGNTYK